MFGCSQNNIQYPETRKKISVMIIGVLRVNDPYRWLKMTDQETEEWVVEQNKLTYSYLEKIPSEIDYGKD